MFERYTERARRVIFFARCEASEFGTTTIESEHFLLGLLRENPNMWRLLKPSVQASQIKELVEAWLVRCEKVRVKRLGVPDEVSTSIDLPLSAECKQIVQYTADEADRFGHRLIGTEHLLLGILRQDCVAAQILKEVGFDLENVREQLARNTTVPPIQQNDIGGRRQQHFLVPDAETAVRRAEHAWTHNFDTATIDGQRPFKVEQRFGVWIVSGSAPPESVIFAFVAKMGGILVLGQGDQSKL